MALGPLPLSLTGLPDPRDSGVCSKGMGTHRHPKLKPQLPEEVRLVAHIVMVSRLKPLLNL